MLLEENKAIVRRFIETYNKHDYDSLDEFMSPDYFDHSHQCDREVAKQLFIMGFKAFPDWHEKIEDIIAEGDKVWVRLSRGGTHTGEWNPVWAEIAFPPTGKKITTMAVDIYRIVNGKLVEYWNVSDGTDFQKQLGLIEYTEKGKKLFPEDAK